ncbi:hypothetical protein V3N99_13945 [Dermatophilaceae bacterium Soc4.6]
MSVVTRRPPTAVRVTTTATTGTGARSTRARVPWGTVVPLAVALALANSFWMVVLRGAVGAVERTQQPFLSWWRDSLLTLPFATLAVLVAVQVARRLLGRTRGRFGFLISWLLVVAFGTVAGLMQVALSAVYDYVLQTRENVMMTTGNGGMCSGPDCLERMQHATMALQLRALGFGAGVILVTNLVVTIWVIAIRGGRLDLVGRGGGDSGWRFLRQSPWEPQDRAGLAPDVRLLLALALVGTGVIHAAVLPEHLAEWPAAGVFFVVLCLAEGALASVLLLGPGRPDRSTQLVLTVLVSGGPLVVWAWSRVLGLPFGPGGGAREPVGAADVVSCLLELGALLAALACLGEGSRLRLLPELSPARRAASLLAVISLTTVALQTLGLGFGPM